MAGDTDFLTDQEINLSIQLDWRAGMDGGHCQRKDDCIFVSQCPDIKDFKPFGDGPLHADSIHIVGSCPIRNGGQSGIARAAPIDFPTRLHAKLQTQAQGFILTNRCCCRYQTRRSMVDPVPGAFPRVLLGMTGPGSAHDQKNRGNTGIEYLKKPDLDRM